MELNEEQITAIKHKEGPLLIVAGAGTGKTTVITERIKWLLEQGLAKPDEILALTFTEKAAKEMEERVDQALPYGTFGMWINTFHSFCDRILKSESLQIGLNPHYKLLTEAETYLLVKKNFWKFKLEHFRPHGNPYKFIEGMTQHFSRLKDEDIDAEAYRHFSKFEIRNSKFEIPDGDEKAYEELSQAYETYEHLKIDEGVMDFADLITNTLKLFRTRKNVLARYQKQFKYILVDEFQDTNYAQYQLVKLLAADDSNLTVVGDDSQSIYKFRGAAISNILTFMKDYPKAKQVLLTKNYRSTQTILDAAYKLIKHNDPDTLEAKLGINKNLVSQVKNGEDVELIRVERVEQEAEEVVNKIKNLKLKINTSSGTKNLDYKDIAILVRANNHADPFVRSLERGGIPFQFLGPGRLFHQPEVKDLIAYLKILADFTDTVSLYRVLSMEVFDIKQRDLIALLNQAKKKNISLFEEMEQCKNARMQEFVSLVHRHQELIAKETGGQILYYFLEDSGLLKNITNWEEKRAKNLAGFFDKIKAFEMGTKEPNLFNLVEYLNLAMDLGESPLAAETDWSQTNAVNILTLHSAKGLEFPVVFLVNLIEGRFPTYERKEQIPIPDKLIKETLPVGDYHLEEERRLFYVGMTRAKEKLFFSAASFYGEGKRERKLSPFVLEAGINSKLETRNSKQNTISNWQRPKEKVSDFGFRISDFKIDYLSYSAIRAFKDCPLHYKLRYILRIPTPTTAPLSFGSSIHAALNEYHKRIMNYELRIMQDEQEKTLMESLTNNWIVEGYTSKKHEEGSLEKAKKFLRQYLETDLHKKAKPIYLEQTFTFKIDPTSLKLRGASLKIGGKIDRVDEFPNGGIEVIDYKTGANVPTQKDIDLDLQMTIYALAATEVLQRPIEKVKLSFYFFDTQTKMSTVRTKEQLEIAKKELLAIRDEIEKSDFSCSGSRTCENCEFRILCG